MKSQDFHNLEIYVDAPKKAIIDEQYHIKYTIKNLSNVPFPGAKISIAMFWTAIGNFLVNDHPMHIKELKPGEETDFDFDQLPEVSGMTVLLRPDIPEKPFLAKDLKPIKLFFPNGNEIQQGQVIHSVRVKSLEEISEAKNTKIAAVSLVLLVIFAILDLILRIFYNN